MDPERCQHAAFPPDQARIVPEFQSVEGKRRLESFVEQRQILPMRDRCTAFRCQKGNKSIFQLVQCFRRIMESGRFFPAAPDLPQCNQLLLKFCAEHPFPEGKRNIAQGVKGSPQDLFQMMFHPFMKQQTLFCGPGKTQERICIRIPAALGKIVMQEICSPAPSEQKVPGNRPRKRRRRN